MQTEQQNIINLWSSMQTNWLQYKRNWDEISRYVGITLDTDNMFNPNVAVDKRVDEYVDDPTCAISVFQAGDYMVGIMWGTGDNVFDIVPSRYVMDLATEGEVNDWYGYVTDQTLYHMNHPNAGLHTCLKPYAYHQFAFGTSGIGVFPNKAFKERIDDNALNFNAYSVANTCIDEGKSGLAEYVFTKYFWTIGRIVGEFCMRDGVLDEKLIAELPDKIGDLYRNKDMNKTVSLVFGVYPRNDFNPKLKGKRGTRYKGVWFMDEGQASKIFREEDFSERPIAMARQIKLINEKYGRSSGTMLISTIRSVNFMVGETIQIIEKMSEPSLGIFNNALFGDSVLDTSSRGLTVFNSMAAGDGQNPVFPIHDVENPAAIIQFLIPYLNDKLTTAFKVDALLDFSSAKEMTATESLQRYAIRGKSLSGMLQQQKIELLEPITKRSISILEAFGEYGVNPNIDENSAKKLEMIGKPERIIPQAVLDVMASGRAWYEIKWNNELEKLTRTEAVQNLSQMLQAIGSVAALYPAIVEAVDWHTLLSDINNNLNPNNKILLSAEAFKEIIAAKAQQQQAMMMAQAAMVGGQVNKDNSQANLNQVRAIGEQGK